jgi:hypothetical protein
MTRSLSFPAINPTSNLGCSTTSDVALPGAYTKAKYFLIMMVEKRTLVLRGDLLILLSLCALVTVVNARRMGDSTAFLNSVRYTQYHHQKTPVLSLQHQEQQCARQPNLPLHVMKPLDEMASAVGDEEDNEEDGDGDDPASLSSSFYDLESIYDPELPGMVESFSEFDRDEDEILTEREDRFYVDEKGERRKVEKCILVGVEDLSARRKLHKRMSQNMRYAEIGYTAVDEEDMLFTLDESLTEMRELIKTAGLECVAGKPIIS